MTQRAPVVDGERDILLALTRLMARWSSSEVQGRIARGVGVSLDSTAIRAIYLLGVRGGSARPSELADELHLARPATSKLIARLEAELLIEKVRDARDRRSAQITLSASGADAYARLTDAGHRMIAGATQDWSEADVSRLTDLLHHFADRLIAESGQRSLSTTDSPALAGAQSRLATGESFDIGG